MLYGTVVVHMGNTKKKRIQITIPIDKYNKLKKLAEVQETTISKILLSASEVTQFVSYSIPLESPTKFTNGEKVSS